MAAVRASSPPLDGVAADARARTPPRGSGRAGRARRHEDANFIKGGSPPSPPTGKGLVRRSPAPPASTRTTSCDILAIARDVPITDGVDDGAEEDEEDGINVRLVSVRFLRSNFGYSSFGHP